MGHAGACTYHTGCDHGQGEARQAGDRRSLHARWRGRTGAAQHNGARLAERDAREVHQLVLADHDLLDHLAAAQLDRLRRVECGRDLAACARGGLIALPLADIWARLSP